MSLAVNTALMALHKIGVFCTEPYRVPMAGTITHCFFDKTGTLTSDKLSCTGVVTDMEYTNDDDIKIEDVNNLNNDTSMESIAAKYVIAGCHSLISINEGGGGGGELLGDPICVVKGSPEVILGMLSNPPEGYLSTYRILAKRGMRVLAMAAKGGTQDCDKWSRSHVESDLHFAGFITFACDLRNDTATVLKALSDAKMPCIMLTGDSALTAAHVANEIGIFSDQSYNKPKLMLTKDRIWEDIKTDEVYCPYTASYDNIRQLANKADLIVGGDVLSQLEEEGDKTLYKTAHVIKVFARVSPQQKEEVVRYVKKEANEDKGTGGDNMLHPLMCGDGGNDVGALKQADVGVALLSGFGDSNASSSSNGGDNKLLEGEGTAEDKLEEDQKLLGMRERQLAKEYKTEFNARRQVIMQHQQEWFQEELNKLTNNNQDNVGFTTYFQAMKNSSARLRSELTKVQKELQGKYGTNAAWGSKGKGGGFMATVMENAQKQMENNNDEQSQEGMKPVVQLGDASVAAPFTSRAPSIRSVSVHLYVLVKAMDLAKTAMGDKALEDLYEFERNRDEKLNKMMDESGFGDDIFSMFK
ncbi:hypothetical protein FOL47_000277 [Perkinsus chesapeaki]|uniref:Cation-transporting atpase n=1 Tax=Perkinsus chesapeaki TaxID=330153 RepID=A0A7J6MMT2_PERCH|nr:hypothetical protein FOL47_000277 [Perkinsus chesapeaki]